MLLSFPSPATFAPALRALFEAAGWHPGRVADPPVALTLPVDFPVTVDYPPELHALLRELGNLRVAGRQELTFVPDRITVPVIVYSGLLDRQLYPIGVSATGLPVCADRYGSLYLVDPEGCFLYGLTFAEGLAHYLLPSATPEGLRFNRANWSWGPEQLYPTWPDFAPEQLAAPATALPAAFSPLAFSPELRNRFVAAGWYPGRGADPDPEATPPAGIRALIREFGDLSVRGQKDIHFAPGVYEKKACSEELGRPLYVIGHDAEHNSLCVDGHGSLYLVGLIHGDLTLLGRTFEEGLSHWLLGESALTALCADVHERSWGLAPGEDSQIWGQGNHRITWPAERPFDL